MQGDHNTLKDVKESYLKPPIKFKNNLYPSENDYYLVHSLVKDQLEDK